MADTSNNAATENDSYDKSSGDQNVDDNVDITNSLQSLAITSKNSDDPEVFYNIPFDI